MKIFGAIAVLLVLSSGCSAKGARFQDTPFAEEKIPADKSRIIFFRGSDIALVAVTLSIDDAVVGHLAQRGFIVADTIPGDHKISAAAGWMPASDAKIMINTIAGDTYYFRVAHRTERELYGLFGIFGTAAMLADREAFKIQPVAPASAQLELKEFKLSE